MKRLRGNKRRIFALSLALCIVFMLITPLDSRAASNLIKYSWEEVRGVGKCWDIKDYSREEYSKEAVLSEIVGDDEIPTVIYIKTEPNDGFENTLKNVKGNISSMYFWSSGKYVVGSPENQLKLGGISVSAKEDLDIEIFGDVGSLSLSNGISGLNILIHGNVDWLQLGGDLYHKEAISGNIVIEGDVTEYCTLYLKDEAVTEPYYSYYTGNLDIKGTAESVHIYNITENNKYVSPVNYGKAENGFKIESGDSSGNDAPYYAQGYDDLILYMPDGIKSRLSDFKTDYTAICFFDPAGLKTLLSAKQIYGVSITPILLLKKDSTVSDEDRRAIYAAGGLIADYSEFSKKNNSMFSEFDPYTFYGGERTYDNQIFIYDRNGQEVYKKEAGKILSEKEILVDTFDVYKRNGSEIDVDYHTQEEIKAFINEHPSSFLMPEYDSEPIKTAPYDPGSMKVSVLNDALNMLNQIRYIAGLSYDVGLKPEYIYEAQAATLINDINNSMTHSPSCPEGMSYELYYIACNGAAYSNLGMMRNKSLAQVILSGWIWDSDYTNIPYVGHRRMALNPKMGATGFGQVGIQTAMINDDKTGTVRGCITAWPAQNTPVSYFSNDEAWSYSSGETEDISKVAVTLTRTNTGESWYFSYSSSSGFFNVDNTNFGMKGCVVFMPYNISYAAGDTFEVKITGLSGGDVSYHVNFFDLNSVGASVCDSSFDPGQDGYTGWYVALRKSYWYENALRQGNEGDSKCFWYEGTLRGREIYDPASDGWYWLDANANGAKAVNKEVFMPYIYQEEEDHLNSGDDAWIKEVASLSNRIEPYVVDLSAQIEEAVRSHGKEGAGKWVRYNAEGKMIKGWYTVAGNEVSLYPNQAGNTYFYDYQTGLMAKGRVNIGGVEYYFDEITGALQQ